MTAAHPLIVANPASPRITVLQSTGRPDDTTNPYLMQLFGALPPAVELRYFSIRDALLSRYDVFHVHWPEYLLRHDTWLGTAAKQVCMFLVLLRLWAMRTPVVRTLHNLRPHEDGGRRERALLAWLDRLTTRRIRIDAAAGNDDGAPAQAADTILHGHYCDWFASAEVPASVPGRLLHFGLLRPYKGVEGLLASFHDVADGDISLRIVGNPASAAMRDTVQAASCRDARVGALLQYVDNDVLAHEIGQAQLVVLPYRQMLNSGALLLALSLARPVLAPWSEANAAIAEEVGEGWLLLYRGELDAATLGDALRRQAARDPRARPDLSRRDWPALGAQHYGSYVRALHDARR